MNKIAACIFPETLPDESLLFPLVQVFEQLVYLQAVEDEPLETDSSFLFTQQLLRQGTLQLLTPIPLGEQRERFLALTSDIQRRGDDYTSQLSMLTLAGLPQRRGTESKNAILTTLLQSGNIESRKEEEEELLLWQSRLMLKLGEFFDAEQAAVNEALQKITSRQGDLLAELREETDNPFSLPASLHDSDHETDGILRHRLKAWSRLYFHGPTQPQIFVTCHEAAIDTLQEVFEKNHRQSATLIASLELPARRDPASSDSLTPDPVIRQGSGLQTALTALTTTETFTPAQTEEMIQLFAECAAIWSQILEGRYPAEQHGRCTLDLFLFPGISSRQLFLESFTGSSSAEEADKGRTGSSGALVGLLKREGDSG